MNIKQKFKVYCSTNINDSVNKELVDSLVREKEPLILEAIASSNSVDLDGDYMTNECLEDMKNQAIGLSIFLDHEHTIDKIVGTVIEVIETSSDIFKIKFSVLPKYEWYITDLLENNINLGLSIGASVLDYEETDTGWKIDKVKLVEISIVGIPANWDTYGTVQTSKELGIVTAKCFNGACKQIIDNLKLSENEFIEKDIEDGEDPQDDGIITEKEVIDLINEACIQLKNEIITEIVAEFNLDGKKYDKTSEEQSDEEEMNMSETEQINETNSSNDEDKEKSLDMEKEEIIELIKENSLNEDIVKELIIDALKEFKEEDVTETPIIKEEEVEVTKSKKEEEEEEEEEEEMDKSCEDDEKDEKDKSKKEEEEEEEEEELEKSSEETEETSKSFDLEELKKSIRQEIEEDILKSLSTERKPVAHEQPKVEDVMKEANKGEVEKKGNVMSTREMAKHLLG